MRVRSSVRLVGGALVAVALVQAGAGAAAAQDDRRNSVPAEVAASVACAGSDARGTGPVLLVHGTGSTAAESWSTSFQPVLLADGFLVCTVDVVGREVGEMQDSADWVADAVRYVAARHGGRVDVVGHSQGGVLPRLALRLHPDLASKVDDLVLLAGTQHGTAFAAPFCAAGCAVAVLQQAEDSQLLTALNHPRELWGGGVSYTTVRSTTDEVVFPTDTSKLAGASNIAVQDVCPGRVTTHLGLLYDSVAYAAALDALDQRGPARVERLSSTLCVSATVPGMDPSAIPSASLAAFIAIITAPPVAVEPPVRIPGRGRGATV
jgi:pimeloyl-ACP methyl ester carboxylesterase